MHVDLYLPQRIFRAHRGLPKEEGKTHLPPKAVFTYATVRHNCRWRLLDIAKKVTLPLPVGSKGQTPEWA